MLFMMPNPRVVAERFVECAEAGCEVKSGVADFPAMTLRCGMNRCLDHIILTHENFKTAPRPDLTNTTLIFYDLELSRDGEIEQIGATVLDNDRLTFSSVVRTSVRTSTSPTVRTISASWWAAIATSPANAITDFVRWIKRIHFINTNGNDDESNIMLAAHNGSLHDHIKLIRMMMINGITPPNYRLVDTLVMFKLLKGRTKPASLSTLRDTYAPWIDHIAHDADSDAAVLKYVVTLAYPQTKWSCYPFGIQCTDYIDRTGMNMYLPSPIVSLSRYDATSYSLIDATPNDTDTDSDSIYESTSEGFSCDRERASNA
jgi:hypothetical protein